MTSIQDKSSIPWFRTNRISLISLLFCLIVIWQEVKSRSISEVLSNRELQDESQLQPASSNNDAKANNDDMVENSEKPMPQRRPFGLKVVKHRAGRQPSKRQGSSNNNPGRVGDLGYMSRTAQAALNAFALIQQEEAELQAAQYASMDDRQEPH